MVFIPNLTNSVVKCWKPPMAIAEVLKDFIKCWKAYNENTSSDEEVKEKINRGDCGLVAIVVHYILLTKFGIETTIKQNHHHCWLVFENDDYDTLKPEGYHPDRPANFVWSKDGHLETAEELTFAEACEEFMSCDAFGGYLVKAFVERYELPMPAELQHCIDNVAEYERPEEIPVLEAKAALAKAIPL